MLLIEAKNVSFSYGDKVIFNQMNFRMTDQEHIALVGKNGAGKSTFLHLLTGKLLADGGVIETKAGLKVGLIQQHLHFKPQKTIHEVLQDAFQTLFAAEEKMTVLAQRMQKPDPDPSLIDTYGELQELLITNDFYTAEARIRELADGLGLSALGLDTPVGRMSGGQLTKLCLGQLLLEQPEILLLDEPTNYLDVAHIDWLIGYLQNYRHAYLVISHDVDFLNQIAQIVYHLEDHQLFRYIGNYQQFLAQHEIRREQQEIAFRQQQREIKKLETYIQKNKVRTATARQAKSREKKLNKIERMEPPAAEQQPHFQFQVRRQPVRVIFSAENLRVGYDRPLLPPIDWQLIRGEKLAIVGHNGIGKTTFIRTLLGELPPLSGRIQRGDWVEPGYFAQIAEPPAVPALEWLAGKFRSVPEQVLRRHLAQCGVSAEHMRQPMNTLSGGEETKVRIGRLMLQPGNLLILDEPTNHLDPQTKQALAEALDAYEGTILIVCHEKDFYQSWIDKIWDIEDWSGKETEADRQL